MISDRKRRVLKTLMMHGKHPYNMDDLERVTNLVDAHQADPYCNYSGVPTVILCDRETGKIWCRELKPEEAESELPEVDFAILDERWRSRKMIRELIACYYYDWWLYLDDPDASLAGVEISEAVYKRIGGKI